MVPSALLLKSNYKPIPVNNFIHNYVLLCVFMRPQNCKLNTPTNPVKQK